MFAIILFTVFLGVSCGTSFDLDNQLLYFVEPPPPLSNGITSGKTDIAQCSQFTEQGVFFGKEGGYAILSPQFVVGMSFSFELELKQRTKTAVLLSVGVLEFLSLQLLNGTIKFAVDNGAGMESVIYDPTSSSNALCDGHWHQIKIIKKKNLITLNVDGKSNLHIMKEEDPETKPGRSCKELINECATDSHDCSPPALYNSPEQAERIKRNKKKIHGLVHVSGLCVLFADNHQIYIRHVPIRVIHKFTLFQVACLAILWTIKSIKSTSIAFATIMLVVMVAVRKAMERCFSEKDLNENQGTIRAVKTEAHLHIPCRPEMILPKLFLPLADLSPRLCHRQRTPICKLCAAVA